MAPAAELETELGLTASGGSVTRQSRRWLSSRRRAGTGRNRLHALRRDDSGVTAARSPFQSERPPSAPEMHLLEPTLKAISKIDFDRTVGVDPCHSTSASATNVTTSEVTARPDSVPHAKELAI